MNFKDSKTKENLMKAYLRESGAYNEYTFYAEQAKKDGYEKIYNTFTLFAANEKAHAKVWFKLFHGIADTEENLKDAADLEHFEHSTLYKEFSEVAKQEGYLDIAELFLGVAKIEEQHEKQFRMLAEKVKNQTMFESKEKEEWKCNNCGHIHSGKQPPEKCPVCSHPMAFFEIYCPCE